MDQSTGPSYAQAVTDIYISAKYLGMSHSPLPHLLFMFSYVHLERGSSVVLSLMDMSGFFSLSC